MNNNLMEINKYAYDLLNRFNQMHRTCYGCNFGIASGDMASSELNTYSHIITIDLPSNKLDGISGNSDTAKIKTEALKLLVGHLLAHHIYLGLEASFTSGILKTLGNGQAILKACCIETAADLHAVRLYTELTGHRPDKAVLIEYAYLIAPSTVEDTVAYSIQEIQGGALPFFMRIQLIKKYTSFKTNRYSIVLEIASYINMVSKKAIKRTIVSREDAIKLSAIFEIDNFPNRVNRIRRR